MKIHYNTGNEKYLFALILSLVVSIMVYFCLYSINRKLVIMKEKEELIKLMKIAEIGRAHV